MFNSKILFITPAFYPSIYYGGPIYSTYELAKALMKNGIDVKVITTNANGNDRLNLQTGVFHKLENDIQVKYYKSLDSRGTSLSMLFNLRCEIKEADLIYLISIFSFSTPLTILLCKFFKKSLIISPRGQLGKWCLDQGNKFKKVWLRLFIQPITQSVNHNFCWHLTSIAEEKDVVTLYPSVKTFVVPNGVCDNFPAVINRSKDRSFYSKYSGTECSNSKIIISLSRIHRKKGYDILIAAFDILSKQKPDYILFIAGEDFGERKNLENIIYKFKLKEKVFLIGPIEGTEKINFLQNADVFALASHDENFGMVYAEALAAGTPIVASKNTPWQEVEKYNCGKWVENTPEVFADAIFQILNSDYSQMSINAQKFVRENYSMSKVVNEFKMIMDKLIGDK